MSNPRRREIADDETNFGPGHLKRFLSESAVASMLSNLKLSPNTPGSQIAESVKRERLVTNGEPSIRTLTLNEDNGQQLYHKRAPQGRSFEEEVDDDAPRPPNPHAASLMLLNGTPKLSPIPSDLLSTSFPSLAVVPYKPPKPASRVLKESYAQEVLRLMKDQAQRLAYKGTSPLEMNLEGTDADDEKESQSSNSPSEQRTAPVALPKPLFYKEEGAKRASGHIGSTPRNKPPPVSTGNTAGTLDSPSGIVVPVSAAPRVAKPHPVGSKRQLKT